MWEIHAAVLSLKQDDGNLLIPDALEIFDAVFNNEDKIRGISISNPQTKYQELGFERYVASLYIQVLAPTGSIRDGLTLKIIGKLNGIIIPIPIENILNSIDHIIYQSCWFPLENRELKLIRDIFLEIGIINNQTISLKQYIQLAGRHELEGILIDDAQDKINAKQISEDNLALDLTGLKATLYPYQVKGINWLEIVTENNLGCVLGDEMGVGKTLQIIGLLLLEKGKKRAPSLLVIPASLIENWKREFHRFAPSIKYYVHHGEDRTGLQSDLLSVDVVITTYDIVNNDLYFLKLINWNLLIIDEAQAIRNPDAQRTIKIKQIHKRAGIAMTGTPLVNKFRDLWSISDFSNINFLGNLADFEARYPYEVESARIIEKRVSPILLRRELKDVATDLPPKIIVPEWISFDKQEAELYDSVLMSTVEDEKPSFANLVHLRMFCCHPSLVLSDYTKPMEYSTKFNRLLELLDEIFDASQKVLIFSEYTKIIDILEKEISFRYGILTRKIYGSVSQAERQNNIDEFSKIHGAACLIINYQAGGVGLNLQAANHVILYNPVWNPADEDQAIGRAYRRGQERKVVIHRLIYTNSIEEIMDQYLQKKRTIIEEAVDGVRGEAADLDLIWKELRKQKSKLKRGE